MGIKGRILPELLLLFLAPSDLLRRLPVVRLQRHHDLVDNVLAIISEDLDAL